MRKELFVYGGNMLASLIVLAAVASCLVACFAFLLASRVVLPRRRKGVGLRSYGDDVIELERTRETSAEGIYGVWADAQGKHFVVGGVLPNQEANGRWICREVLQVSNAPPISEAAENQVRWTGHVFHAPGEDAFEVDLPVAGGRAPAWVIPSRGSVARVWAVHVHGSRTTRVTALRSVPVATSRGYTSIVPSFRGDGEGPSTGRNASALGQAEWRDVEEAIAFAVAHGAEEIVLFGWSLGGQIALQLAERSAYRYKVRALVLIAPTLDWRSTIRHGATQAGLPPGAGRLAELALSSRFSSGLLGLSEPIRFAELDWLNRRVNVQSLVLHSTGDPVVPASDSAAFARANNDLVEMVNFPGQHHAWEYNQDPTRFDEVIGSWLDRTVRNAV